MKYARPVPGSRRPMLAPHFSSLQSLNSSSCSHMPPLNTLSSSGVVALLGVLLFVSLFLRRGAQEIRLVFLAGNFLFSMSLCGSPSLFWVAHCPPPIGLTFFIPARFFPHRSFRETAVLHGLSVRASSEGEIEWGRPPPLLQLSRIM